MVSLLVILMAGMSLGHTDFSSDDMRNGTGGFVTDQRGKLVLLKSDSWPDQVGFAEAREALTDFLAMKGNTTTHIGTGGVESKGRVPLKNHAGIGNHVAGDIHYTLMVKDNGSGFDYWFTDLMYQPYRNDRYGKRIKATVSPIPLESQLSKINEQIWQKQKTYAYEVIAGLADELAVRLETVGKPAMINIGM